MLLFKFQFDLVILFLQVCTDVDRISDVPTVSKFVSMRVTHVFNIMFFAL